MNIICEVDLAHVRVIEQELERKSIVHFVVFTRPAPQEG